MAQFQIMEGEHPDASDQADYIKPVLRAIFSNEPLPADPAAEPEAVLDRRRRLWTQFQHFVKQAGMFVACNVLARVQSHHPTVDVCQFEEGLAARTTPQQALDLRATSRPAADAIVKSCTFFRESSESSSSQ